MESGNAQDEPDGYAHPGCHQDRPAGAFPGAVGPEGCSGNEEETPMAPMMKPISPIRLAVSAANPMSPMTGR